MDSNDDGKIDISDPVYTLQWLFLGGFEPSAPGPRSCGVDPTVDALADCRGNEFAISRIPGA